MKHSSSDMHIQPHHTDLIWQPLVNKTTSLPVAAVPLEILFIFLKQS